MVLQCPIRSNFDIHWSFLPLSCFCVTLHTDMNVGLLTQNNIVLKRVQIEKQPKRTFILEIVILDPTKFGSMEFVGIGHRNTLWVSCSVKKSSAKFHSGINYIF